MAWGGGQALDNCRCGAAPRVYSLVMSAQSPAARSARGSPYPGNLKPLAWPYICENDSWQQIGSQSQQTLPHQGGERLPPTPAESAVLDDLRLSWQVTLWMPNLAPLSSAEITAGCADMRPHQCLLLSQPLSTHVPAALCPVLQAVSPHQHGPCTWLMSSLGFRNQRLGPDSGTFCPL